MTNGSKFDTADLTRGTVTEQIMADLRDQIVRGKLPRGSKLPNERTLAERYKVSSNTIREAVRGLAAIKMVEPRHGAGTYVTAEADAMFAAAASTVLEMENINILEIFALLGILHERIILSACEVADDAELAKLGPLLDRLEHAQDVGELITRLEIFFEALANASHNALIAFISKFLMRLLFEVARGQEGGLGPEFADRLSADRRRLVNALVARDAEAAVHLAARYQAHAVEMARDLVERAGDDHLRQAYRRVRQA